ncbi:Gip2p [Saccharomyces cerevisiae x Saccharomyces kudriavzevii VIN7]|uniref:Gip2p n=1 Tax=Saccharomyces cerevisiae x Saccharomyces kudriavzevii (strain VIN7) TaxID=1095631 RepID=H0GTV6_SACCK|nr:Gip2p [Saccharomyces cerevisiae x Saccharomyces kudriavzevii VIN7]
MMLFLVLYDGIAALFFTRFWNRLLFLNLVLLAPLPLLGLEILAECVKPFGATVVKSSSMDVVSNPDDSILASSSGSTIRFTALCLKLRRLSYCSVLLTFIGLSSSAKYFTGAAWSKWTLLLLSRTGLPSLTWPLFPLLIPGVVGSDFDLLFSELFSNSPDFLYTGGAKGIRISSSYSKFISLPGDLVSG